MAERSKGRAQEQSIGSDTEEEIRRRAYEISQTDDAGTADENWHRAEREFARSDDTGGGTA